VTIRERSVEVPVVSAMSFSPLPGLKYLNLTGLIVVARVLLPTTELRLTAG
jgi:hypothetical protein